MPQETAVVIPVKLDEKTFKRFARFDMFTLRRRWVRPAIFSLAMILFSVLALLSRRPQSGLIAGVLLTVGVLLPVVYVGSFMSQVNLQAVQQKLKPAARVYTLRLEEYGVTVNNDRKKEETVYLKWEEIRQAYRVKGCVYLYVSVARAFLLPNGQANVSDDELWAYMEKHLGKEKCKNKMGGKGI